MKRFRFLFFAMVGLLNCFNLFAQDFYGENGVAYVIIHDGVKVVQNVYMQDAEIIIPSSVSYKGIEYPVVEIAPQAFGGFNKLQRIVLPEGLKRIGDMAFSYCENLTRANLPSTLESIGAWAFFNANKFNLTTEDKAILEHVELGDQCFNFTQWYNELSGDVEVYFGKYLYLIKGKLSGEYVVKPGTTHIMSEAFDPWMYRNDFKELTSVKLPEGLLSIGANAFAECPNLSTINLPASLKKIDVRAFYKCTKLNFNTNLLAPDIELGYHCFDQTKWFENQPNGLIYVGNNLYDSKGKIKGDLYIKPGITHIIGESFCFYNRDNELDSLVSVSFPASLKHIGRDAFNGCKGLKKVEFRQRADFSTDLKSIGNQAFFMCNKLTDIILPASLSEIEESAFAQCTALQHINFPPNLKIIGEKAFEGCVRLNFDFTKDPLPEGVMLMEKCFHNTKWYEDCKNDVLYAGTYLYAAKGQLPAHLDIKEGTKRIMPNVFRMNGPVYPNNIETITFPSTLEYIGKEAFRECDHLKGELVFPSALIEIADGAFQSCINISGVRFKDDLTSAVKQPQRIGNSAFASCEKLNSVSFSSRLEMIGGFAFSYTDLKSLTLPESVIEIGSGAFMRCESIPSLVLPVNVRAIGTLSFFGCLNLKDIEIKNPDMLIREMSFPVPFNKLDFSYNGFQIVSFDIASPDESVASIEFSDFWNDFYTEVNGPGEVDIQVNLTVIDQYKHMRDSTYSYRIKMAGESYRINMPAEGYLTFTRNKAYKMAEGLNGYELQVKEGKLVADCKYPSGSVVPAKTPLLLQGKPGCYLLTFEKEESLSSRAANLDDTNMLKAVLTNDTITAPSNMEYFVLRTVNDVPGFYYQEGCNDGSQVMKLAGQAYLEVPSAVSTGTTGYPLDKDLTSITEVVNQVKQIPDVVYTLDGQRIETKGKRLLPGIYVSNGIKIYIAK